MTGIVARVVQNQNVPAIGIGILSISQGSGQKYIRKTRRPFQKQVEHPLTLCNPAS